jgi:hypothetical protein
VCAPQTRVPVLAMEAELVIFLAPVQCMADVHLLPGGGGGPHFGLVANMVPVLLVSFIFSSGDCVSAFGRAAVERSDPAQLGTYEHSPLPQPINWLDNLNCQAKRFVCLFCFISFPSSSLT